MNRPYVKPSMLVCKKHPELGLWCREDGAVLIPENYSRKAHWTYGSKNKHGYLKVRFKWKMYYSHRLIAETFLENPLGLPTVDHINRDKTANFVGNLRYGSYKLQNNNRQVCESSLARYGVRVSEDKNAYYRARYAEQKSLGRRKRICPDGKRRMLTDDEFSTQFGQTRLF